MLTNKAGCSQHNYSHYHRPYDLLIIISGTHRVVQAVTGRHRSTVRFALVWCSCRQTGQFFCWNLPVNCRRASPEWKPGAAKTRSAAILGLGQQQTGVALHPRGQHRSHGAGTVRARPPENSSETKKATPHIPPIPIVRQFREQAVSGGGKGTGIQPSPPVSH